MKNFLIGYIVTISLMLAFVIYERNSSSAFPVSAVWQIVEFAGWKERSSEYTRDVGEKYWHEYVNSRRFVSSLTKEFDKKGLNKEYIESIGGREYPYLPQFYLRSYVPGIRESSNQWVLL